MTHPESILIEGAFFTLELIFNSAFIKHIYYVDYIQWQQMCHTFVHVCIYNYNSQLFDQMLPEIRVDLVVPRLSGQAHSAAEISITDHMKSCTHTKVRYTTHVKEKYSHF